jgi:hypothetical protein
MVLKPDSDTFDKLTKLAGQGETFDGEYSFPGPWNNTDCTKAPIRAF